MKIGIWLLQFSVAIGSISYCLYSYQEKQNEVTRLRLQLPLLEQQVRALEEDNYLLQYEIDCSESPKRLMELARDSQFQHLQHPLLKEILSTPENYAAINNDLLNVYTLTDYTNF